METSFQVNMWPNGSLEITRMDCNVFTLMSNKLRLALMKNPVEKLCFDAQLTRNMITLKRYPIKTLSWTDEKETSLHLPSRSATSRYHQMEPSTQNNARFKWLSTTAEILVSLSRYTHVLQLGATVRFISLTMTVTFEVGAGDSTIR